MKDWRTQLYGFSGIFITCSIWTPLAWFVSHTRNHFQSGQWGWLGQVVFVLLVAATLAAQIGFILYTSEGDGENKCES